MQLPDYSSNVTISGGVSVLSGGVYISGNTTFSDNSASVNGGGVSA